MVHRQDPAEAHGADVDLTAVLVELHSEPDLVVDLTHEIIVRFGLADLVLLVQQVMVRLVHDHVFRVDHNLHRH